MSLRFFVAVLLRMTSYFVGDDAHIVPKSKDKSNLIGTARIVL